MKRIYLSLGSNIGNSRKNLEDALDRLRAKIDIIKISSYYETEPVGYADQDWFLNIAVEAMTSLSPEELLTFCQEIETDMKRVKIIRFGPRNIDVDILLYEDFSSKEEHLTIPHPRMKERAFVMVPLCEIAPDLVIDGEDIKTIVDHLEGEQIRKIEVISDGADR